MAHQQYETGLEPARQDYPEVTQGYGYGNQHYQQPPQPYQQSRPYYPQSYDNLISTTPPKQDATAWGSTPAESPYCSAAQPAMSQFEPEPKSPSARTICGCSLPVFVLSCVIALLAAAVIGLAAATGVQAQRASSAESDLSELRASVAGNSTPSQGSNAPVVIDDGCSENPDSVDKTIYTSFSLLGARKFRRYCNKDAPRPPLLSLFTADFATCMDACAAYTQYVPRSFGGATANTSLTVCAAVSFIPAWTDKAIADAGGAPGNCYLKGGPQTEALLTTPNIGVDCHAAIYAGADSSSGGEENDGE
ncbi:uncharacterized protein P884DRAFT_278009 [Thermothelomyces heterothallicus CBS 202.75]|uniref:uncharacterized protein n=1 Tax=Thermothelomyces heterothallicus CBS 202.75 TaxID=1149848 RepID=UPI003743D2AD